jgi:hypothetical protein
MGEYPGLFTGPLLFPKFSATMLYEMFASSSSGSM